MNTKVDLSRQSKLKNLSVAQLSNILNDGESILHLGDTGKLTIASMSGSTVTEEKVDSGEINLVPIPAFPSVFPGANEAYALCAVQSGTGFTLAWALVNTLFDYNDPSGTGTTTGVTYSVQIINPTCHKVVSGNLLPNGQITVSSYSNVSRSYTKDGGSTWSAYTTSPQYTFSNLGDTGTTQYNIAVKDAGDNILYSGTTINMAGTTPYSVSSSYSKDDNDPFQVYFIKVSDSTVGQDNGVAYAKLSDSQSGSGVLYSYGLNDANYTDLTSSTTYTFTGLTSGTHNVYVRKYVYSFIVVNNITWNGISYDITSFEYSTSGLLSFNSLLSSPAIFTYSGDQTGDKTIYFKAPDGCIYTLVQALPSLTYETEISNDLDIQEIA